MTRPPDIRAELLAHPSGRRGTLHTPSGQSVPVQTYERGEEVVLVLLTNIDAPLPPEALDPATLEYTSARGVIRLQGEAVFEHHSLVRFRREGEREVIQRRAFVRVHTPQGVALGPALANGILRAHTIDLSGGGMLLAGAPRLNDGDSVRFELRLGDDATPVKGVARVLRVEENETCAMAFEQIDEGDRQRLIRFVFACLRNARAKTRDDWG